MEFVDTVLDLIGNTPLVRLEPVAARHRRDRAGQGRVPQSGRRVKDRIALRMIDAAEATGELRPGGTIVEPTSGNTGIGLAMVAQRAATSACSSARTR